MAHVTEIQNGATQAPPPPPPTKRAHVRTGKKPPGKPVTRSQDPSPPEALAIDELEVPIFEKMQMYPADEWEKKLSSYLYRISPTIDRGRTGNFHNVQMYTKPVTQDEIMRAKYGGSGRYNIILKRYDPATRITHKIQEEVFTILNQEFPPCIPYGEWIDDDKNREWAWAKPQLEQLARDKENGAPNPAAAAGITDPTFGAVFNILERFMPKQNADQTQALATEVIATMREQHKEQMQAAKGDPGQLVTLVTTIATALKPAAAAAPAGADPVLMLVLNNMRDDLIAAREQNAKLMEKILSPAVAAAKAPTLVEQLKELVELKGTVGSLFGRGNTGAGDQKKTDWAEVVARGFEKIVEEGPRYMSAIFTGRPPGRTIQTHPAARPAAPGEPEPPARELTPAEQEEQTMGAIQDINAQFGATFDEFTPELVKTFDRELTGMDFRDWFIEEFGARVYSFLRKMDVRTILGVIELRKQTAPEHLRPQLALLTPPAKLEKFILEFQSNDDAPDYGEDEEEPAHTPGEPTTTRPREKEF